MSQWIALQLSDGDWQEKHLIHKNTLTETHSSHMPVQEKIFDQMFGYGLGWFTGIHDGHFVLVHGGTFCGGYKSSVVLFPKEKIGVVVLTNYDRHTLPVSHHVSFAIADLLMGAENKQLLTQIMQKEQEMQDLYKQYQKNPGETRMLDMPSLSPLEEYVGEFEHSGYGIVKIYSEQGELFASLNAITYHLKPKDQDRFIGSAWILGEMYFDFSLVRNLANEISELHVTFESHLPSIKFSKKI